MGKDTQNVVGLSIRFVTSLRRYQTSSFAHLGSPTHRHHSTALTNETSCNHPVSVDWKSSNGSWHDVVTRSLPSFPFFLCVCISLSTRFPPKHQRGKQTRRWYLMGFLLRDRLMKSTRLNRDDFSVLKSGRVHRAGRGSSTAIGRLRSLSPAGFCFVSERSSCSLFFLLFETTLDHKKKQGGANTKMGGEIVESSAFERSAMGFSRRRQPAGSVAPKGTEWPKKKKINKDVRK